MAAAVALALLLGFANIAAPALWHDELVHVYATRSVVETGVPRLPSGVAYPSAAVYHYVLAPVMAVFGDGEAAVRAPSVVFGAMNVLLTYLVTRRLLGSAPAVVAAFALALSPWALAWFREARYLAIQQALYLAGMYAFWRAMEAASKPKAIGRGIGAAVVHVAGLFTSYHFLLTLSGAGAYAGLIALWERRWRSRFVAACLVIGIIGSVTVAVYFLAIPQFDKDAIIKEAGLGGTLSAASDPDRGTRWYYLRWLGDNLSRGYLVLALAGFGLMLWKERRRGLYAALAFWGPVLVLTFLIGYRRERFMFFAFPFWVGAYSYALVWGARFLLRLPEAWRARSWWRLALGALLVLFGARVALSTITLLGDTLSVAGGARTTLARQHPEWRKPCAYVRARAGDAVIVATSYLPVLYYAGRCDNWFPSRYTIWEYVEVGHEGLKDPVEFAEYMKKHPRGYFVAEWRRLHYPKLLHDDLAWVEANMRLVTEASSEDVFVYAWGEVE